VECFATTLGCRSWFAANGFIVKWENVEEFLLSAASECHLTEYDLEQFQGVLLQNRYMIPFDLKTEFLMRRLNSRNG
jgi:hypothetical protein